MSTRQFLIIVALVGAFGIVLPMYKGLDFLDRRLIVAYACLSVVIAAPIAADAFASRTDEDPLPLMLRVWLSSWAVALGLLTLALAAVNITNWRGRLLLPNTSFLVAAGSLSLTATAAVVAMTALGARRFSAANLKAAFRALFLLVVVGLFLADRYGAFIMSTSSMTRLLLILSAMFGAAALAMHVILRMSSPRITGP